MAFNIHSVNNNIYSLKFREWVKRAVCGYEMLQNRVSSDVWLLCEVSPGTVDNANDDHQQTLPLPPLFFSLLFYTFLVALFRFHYTAEFLLYSEVFHACRLAIWWAALVAEVE